MVENYIQEAHLQKNEKDGNATAEEKTEFLKSLIERLTITEEEAEKLLKMHKIQGKFVMMHRVGMPVIILPGMRKKMEHIWHLVHMRK